MIMRKIALFFLVMSVVVAAMIATQASAETKPGRIKVEYIAPEKADQQPVYEMLKNRHVLEKVQELFSPFRLPTDLTVKVKTCGMVNAWYARKDRDATLTICYEYVDDIFKKLPKEVTAVGITPIDAAVGQFFYVVGHEMGHAMFDLLDVPVFGRAEDAADQFSAYIMLQMGRTESRRLISGAAYSYKSIIERPEMTIAIKAFSDVHGSSAQRFYNLVCLAYGADPKLFQFAVQKGFLPSQRAGNCYWEYREVGYAFKQLIRPHLDPELTKRVLNTKWLPPENLPVRQQ